MAALVVRWRAINLCLQDSAAAEQNMTTCNLRLKLTPSLLYTFSPLHASHQGCTPTPVWLDVFDWQIDSYVYFKAPCPYVAEAKTADTVHINTAWESCYVHAMGVGFGAINSCYCITVNCRCAYVVDLHRCQLWGKIMIELYNKTAETLWSSVFTFLCVIQMIYSSCLISEVYVCAAKFSLTLVKNLLDVILIWKHIMVSSTLGRTPH